MIREWLEGRRWQAILRREHREAARTGVHMISTQVDPGFVPPSASIFAAPEDYPGQRTTPDACPVCKGPVEREVREQVDNGGWLIAEPSGRWLCPKGCDPRTVAEVKP